MKIYENYERAIETDNEESLSKIINKITENSVVFDVGCSSGMLGKYLSQKKGCVVDGVDIDETAIELCRPIYREVATKNLELDSLTDVFKLQEYDFIVVADVIEHLVNPDFLLSELKQLIKPNGTLIFSVPNITHIASGLELLVGNFKYSPNGLLDNTHLRFYSKQSLLDKLESFGLYAWEIDTVQKEISETEFSDHTLKLFPEKWIKELVAYRQDALTYQWLVSVKSSPNCEFSTKTVQVSDSKFPLLFTTSLFWRGKEDEEFTEEKQLLGQLVTKKESISLIEFHISENSNISNAIDQIRIDPISDQKPFFIVNAEILNLAKETIWAWNPTNNKDEFHGAVFVKYIDSIGSLFQSINNDPQWYPHIDNEILNELDVGYIIRISLIIDDPLNYQYYDQLINRDVAERDAQIENLNQAVIERDAQIENLNQAVIERDAYLKDLMESVNRLNQHHQGILSHVWSSTSLRISKPLRLTVKRTSRLINIIKLMPQIVKHSNGITQTVIKASRIFRNDGINGIRKTLIMMPQQVRYQNSNNVNDKIPSTTVHRSHIPQIDFDSTHNRFVKYQENSRIEPSVKLIAFYLPQFHPFPENDEWWGKGFTEWTNVGKAKPNFTDHYQPHCPIHNGYYDLRIPEVMQEQAKLAKNYGIYGFNYYFYWFGGKILMDSPLENMLKNKKIDMPFCLTWANENWSRRWDGQEHDILIAQNHSDEDSLAFIRHLIKYFKDERYIHIDGKPVLTIYRANIIPNMEATARIWREEMQKHGIPGIYLIAAQTFGIRSPEPFGFDASMEFPPHTVVSQDITNEIELINESYSGHIYSYDQVVANAVSSKEPEYKLFKTAMLSWDNTARKQNQSHIFHNFSLLRYKQWLSSIVNKVHNNPKYSADEKIVFINAWNEWAEGTHLEPDQKFGYGYLQTTFEVIKNYNSLLLKLKSDSTRGINDYAVILHLHYEELWPYISGYLSRSLNKNEYDLYVSVTSSTSIKKVQDDFPNAYIELVENRGRDTLPFVRMLNHIKNMGYSAVCKIHSKRSVYRNDGDEIRDEIFDALIGSKEQVEKILLDFKNNEQLGMIAPNKYLIEHNDHNMTFNKEVVSELSKHLKLNFTYDIFPAGSMFWFKPESLLALTTIDDSLFEIESGLADGQFAHAVERLFCLIVKNSNFKVGSC